jgi:predicted DNA binding CopG/RHH family protein
MQKEITKPSPQPAHDFAGLLAALAAANPTELPPWKDDELPQDVATLSYESALRKHARYKSANVDAFGTPQAGEMQLASHSDSDQRETRSMPRGHQRQKSMVPMSERERKCASVTIRMSHAEYGQLRERAAEAGLTLSAYLRSCTFEAEALRAQVKQALAELRSARVPETRSAQDAEMQRMKAAETNSARKSSTPASRLGWLRRIIPDLRAERGLARA